MLRHGFEPKWLRQLFLGLEGPFLAFMPRWQPNCLTETVDKCPLHLFDKDLSQGQGLCLEACVISKMCQTIVPGNVSTKGQTFTLKMFPERGKHLH